MEIPDLSIQVIDGQYFAVLGETKIPLPMPAILKQEAMERCRLAEEEDAAEALAVCELSYAVVHDKVLEQLIEVVIAAPAGVFESLQENGSLTCAVMGALAEVCPDLESSRIVPM